MATTMPNPADTDPQQPASPEGQAPQGQPEPQQAQPAPPQMFERRDAGDGKIEVRLNTGEVFTGTPDELVDKLAHSNAHTHNYARQLKSQLPPQQTNAQQPASPRPQIDPAEEMIANATAKHLGFQSAAHMRQAVESISSSQQEIQGRIIANQFMAENPDFGPSEHNSRVLTEIINQNGMPETPQTLAMAHLLAKSQGLYEQVTPQPRGQRWSRPQVPPQLPQGSPANQASALTEADLQTMPLDKLQELFNRTKQ